MLDIFKAWVGNAFGLALFLEVNGFSQTERFDLTRVISEARQGNGLAQCELGRRYEHGITVRQSYREALKWYRRAAEQGIPKAQYGLGRFYASGDGVRQNPKEALRWFYEAASRGYALAQNRLGRMYEAGDGVPKDYVEAYRWYSLAAGADLNIYAIINRAELVPRMTEREMALATREFLILSEADLDTKPLLATDESSD